MIKEEETALERFGWISISISGKNSGLNNAVYITPPQDGPVEIKVVPAMSGLHYEPKDAAHILLDDQNRPYLEPGKPAPPSVSQADLYPLLFFDG